MQELARYWGSDYDLRRIEERLNTLPQFLTEIDGFDIHFIHVKSPHEHALPLIITHGWPGSFDVVVPLMPGYGFSENRRLPVGTRSTSRAPGSR
jgi:pimeloyl-ACP methyl ester carboxylesterase